MNISIALCTYNGGMHIQEQLDSIFAQTILPDEIIISDDNSKDNTLEIVKTYQAKYPGVIKIHVHNPNVGIVKNFEFAINACSHDIVFTCDQDDIWFKNKIEKALNFFENNDCDALFHNLQLLSEKDSTSFTVWDYLDIAPDKFETSAQIFKHILFIGNIVTGAAFAFKKGSNKFCFSDDDHFLHDYQLALYFAQKGRLKMYNEILGYYRIHESQQVGAKFKADDERAYLNKLLYANADPANKYRFILNRSKYWEYTDFRKKYNKDFNGFLNKEDFNLPFIPKLFVYSKWFLRDHLQNKIQVAKAKKNSKQ